MVDLNKTCCVCGEKYHYCYGCDSNKPSWMGSFHDENCRDIYHAVAGYYANQYTKDETKKLLDNCDLSNQKKFTEATQRAIKEVYIADKKQEVKEQKKQEVNKILNKQRRR